MMKFTLPKLNASGVKTRLLLVGVFEKNFATGPVAGLNSSCEGSVALHAQVEGFDGKAEQTLLHFPNAKGVAAQQVLYFGLGESGKLTLTSLREALTAAFKRAKQLKVTELSIAQIPLDGTGISAELYAQTVAEYAGMVDYTINHFKTAKGGHKPETHVTSLQFLADDETAADSKRGLEAGRLIATAVNRARDLVNLPPGVCTPTYLAEQATALARRRWSITVRLVQRDEAKKLGMHAFLAVAKGSDQKPVFIELTYAPKNAVPGKVLGLVGKSVTFDTGGYDIKSADGMLTMKCDMAGGAAVLSAIEAIAALKLPITVKAYMAATENCINGKAYKPGDVLQTMAGLTVAVDNTDAEGRLTLADAIAFAREVGGVTHLVDVATLTGAMLGTTADVGAGSFTNNGAWQNEVLAAAGSVDELLWPMPMWPQLKKGNNTPMADLKNTGGKFGAGSSTAALFIAPFAGDTPWVHLDIAGTAYRGREFGADPEGGTGFGTRTLIALAKNLSEAK